nr:hypothetical protein [Tanacetum cinerariifolium]
METDGIYLGRFEVVYLDSEIAKPIIELCSFFKQICAQTFMEDDMVKAKSYLIDILCNLQKIYPHAFFDIMIHLVILYMKRLLSLFPTVGYDHDVIHDNNSSDFALSTSLNDFDFTTYNIDSKSTKVEEPLDIIAIDDDDDFIDDEDGVHHDLADFDDEDLVNDEDDDEVATVNYSSDEEMSTVVAHGHGGDGSGDDPFSPPPRSIGIDCLAIKEGRRGGRDGGRKGVRKETRNLELKKCVDEYCPLKIMFKYNDKGTMLHVGQNTAR